MEVVSIIFCCFPVRKDKSIGKDSILKYFLAVTFSFYLWGKERCLSIPEMSKCYVWDIQGYI